MQGPARRAYGSKRTQSAATQIAKASTSATNTAAEPRSLTTLMAWLCSGVTWSDSFSIAVLSSSTTISAISEPISASHHAMLVATTHQDTSATITRNRSLVFIAGQFVWMELFTHRVYAQLGDDLLARLNPADRQIFESLSRVNRRSKG